MTQKVNSEFLSWIRFIVYDGDLDELYESSTLAKARANAERTEPLRKFIEPIGLNNEVKSWI